MKLTANLGLKKPDGNDVVNIDDFNYNSDKIDLEFNKIAIELHGQRTRGIAIANSLLSKTKGGE